MTDIRELLLEATDDLVIDRGDPLDRVRRATTRRRRTWGATVAVAAAVVAAIVVPIALIGSGSRPAGLAHHPPTPAPKPLAVQRWAPGDIEAAAGFGSIWGLSAAGNGNPGRSWVDRLNPTTGAQIHRYSIPAPTAKIAVGAGRVWVIGQNAGGGGTSYITTIDPTNGAIGTLRLTNPLAEPYDIAFSGGSAWVTMQLLNQVWRLTPSDAGSSPGGFAKSVITIRGGPTDIATTGVGAIWVQRQDSGQLTNIVPEPAPRSGTIGQTVKWSSSIFGPFGSNGLLAAGASGAVGELIPSELNGCDSCAQINGMIAKGQVRAALRTSRGVFVSTTRRTYFYSAKSLRKSSDGTPTASIPYPGDGSLAMDGAGVVVGTGAGLIHWIPAG
jgi:hypothetical protein